MTAERIMDAISLLPDDLLEETNALRQKKRVPWKSLTALAACLCLVAGLWFAFPGAKTADSVAGGSAENNAGIGRVEDGSEIIADQQSSTSSCIAVYSDREFTVDQVYEDHITARVDGLEDFFVIISFEKLQKIPKLKSGQRIRVYWEVESPEIGDACEIAPYKIEIPEKNTK